MFWIWIAVSIFIIAEGLLTLRKALSFGRFFLRKLGDTTEPSVWPKVALLAPCKGVDVNLAANIESWLTQDYPDYNVIFVVESDQDPAMETLRRYGHGQIVVAGPAFDCGQKVHNLRFAIDRFAAGFDVFAFVDSDTRVSPLWLKGLVRGLLEHAEESATGYRWFIPDGTAASALRSIWNASVLTLYDETASRNFAWGGSMALFKQTFVDARVADFWKGSISDDYGVTAAMRAKGKKVHFTSQAMALTEDPVGMFEFFSWAARQLLITRIYNPSLWKAALLYHCGWVLWIITGIWFYPGWFLPLFAVTWLAQIGKAEIRLSCARAAFPGVNPGNRAAHYLLSPLMGLVNFAILLTTAFRRRLSWRGVTYILHSSSSLTIERP